jgi:putative ABC transport system ATP-binding protein
MLLNSEPVIAGTEALPQPVRGELTAADLRFASLDGISFRIEAGECAGIVTADASDAVAILECLSGTAANVTGALAVDGRAVSSLRAESLHGAVLVTPHDSYLFAQTVLENIRDAAPDPEVAWAIEAAAADEVAEALAQGADTPVSEGGRSLSGGQRQRVALARALAADPPILVLHDPTTAVDSVTEARIAAGIRRSRAGRTTVLMTTSPALLAITDRVIFIENGRVVSDSGHSDMLKTHAGYQELVLT